MGLWGAIKSVAHVGLKVAGVASTFIDPTGTLGRGLNALSKTLEGTDKALSAIDKVVKDPKISDAQKEAYIKAYGNADLASGGDSNEQVSESIANIVKDLKDGNLKDIEKRVKALKPDEVIKLYNQIQQKDPGLLVKAPNLIGVFKSAFKQKQEEIAQAQK